MDSNHDCVKGPEFEKMAEEFKSLTGKYGEISTGVALIKRDTDELKSATAAMSKCIQALTESSIKAGENNITRDQFYSKIDAITQAWDRKHNDLATATDTRFDLLEKRVGDTENVCKDYSDLKKWVQGITAALVILILTEGYRIFIMHV